MQLPSDLLISLQNAAGFNKDSFEQVHASGDQVTSIRLNPYKQNTGVAVDVTKQVPWNALGYYLNQRPSFTTDPLFHAGAYYVQ